MTYLRNLLAPALAGAALLLSGCPKSEKQIDPFPAGDELLSQSDPVGACDAFKGVLTVNPNDTHAAFGAALTCGVLLPDSAGITEVLDKCGEPHLDVASKIFGASGFFAKDKLDRAGTAPLTIALGSAAAGFQPLAFTSDTVRTHAEERETWEPGGNAPVTKKFLTVSIKDVQFRNLDPADLYLEVRYDAAHRGNNGLLDTPLSDGLEVAAAELNGSLQFSMPDPATGQRNFLGYPITGSVKFTKVGTGQAGDAIQLELKELVLEGMPACPATGCPPNLQSLRVKISGTVSDAIFSNPPTTLPFQNVKADEGNPYRPSNIVLLDRCPGMSAEYLRGQLKKLLADVETIHGYLAVVTSDANADAFQFKLPGALFSVDGEILFNATDARVLQALLETGLAAGKLAVQYKVLSKPFADLIGTYQLWIDGPSGPIQRAQRDLVIAKLVSDLNDSFLDKQPGFDLAPAKEQLRAALATASAALTHAPQAQGLFNFQATKAQAFATDLNGLFTFVAGTLDNATLAGFPHSPDYKLSLKAFFDAPVTRAELHAASSDGTGIFRLLLADPNSTFASDRNDGMNIEGKAIETAASTFFKLPEDKSSVTCDPSQANTGCPANYTCSANGSAGGSGGSTGGSPTTGTCQMPSLKLLDSAAVDQAMPAGEQPAFFNPESAKPLTWLN